jgi:hypothetical protein
MLLRFLLLGVVQLFVVAVLVFSHSFAADVAKEEELASQTVEKGRARIRRSIV